MSNQNAYKPGSNQSGLDLPTHGPLAYAYSAGYIASACPNAWSETDPEMFAAIERLNLAGEEVCEIAVERIKKSRLTTET